MRAHQGAPRLARPSPRSGRAVPLVVALAALAALACAGVRPPVREGGGPTATAGRVVELALPLPAGTNGAVEDVAPSGARTVVRTFGRPSGATARLRPREAGWHQWRAMVGGREVASGRLLVEAPPDRLRNEGQVVVRGPSLALEDGTPFLPLGENRFNLYDPSWSDGLSPEAYLARMAADGMNTLRIFVFNACGREGAPAKPGCLEPTLGHVDEAAALQYDEILAAAERHGVKVVLAPFAIGYTPGDAWKGWQENPYAAARGGPSATPSDFFRAPPGSPAREAARARLRYVLARWGASPALLAVDLLNEPEWDGPIDENLWIPWAEDLARTWHDEDPWHHPVTAGPVGLHANVTRDERPWWESKGCDLVQWHRYGADIYDVHALAAALVETIRDTRRYGKPVLIGEFGYGGEAKPLYDHTHVGVWTAAFAGAGALSHSAPVFQVDSDEPMTPERGRHFRALAAVLARAERGGPLVPVPDPGTSVPGLRALALAGPRAVAVWLHAPAEGYGQPVEGAKVRVRGLGAGRWKATWLDDLTLAELGRAEVQPGEGSALVTAPAFVRHAVLLLER